MCPACYFWLIVSFLAWFFVGKDYGPSCSVNFDKLENKNKIEEDETTDEKDEVELSKK